ncbi:AUXIN RESPONSE FACTOR 4-RELATED [Salix viminalis]|uniref:Auxin response factor n=1 Tax=Salix viminalis TaxID=40686 RepID=A0A9Q0UGA6_SALVM|nr:AUXIN RESPONSE FACTOR 4-RELATED [Salix viminalis]
MDHVERGCDDLYTELWKACAGPLVDVPKAGERVFYFPQGHMEQLEASTNQELNQQIPRFNLPPKILCRVINIQLLAEQDTDEVYAQIALHPEADQTEPTTPMEASLFSEKHANECLPPLDMSQATPTQELAARDLHGFEWRFKHIFRGQPRRHLLTTGWSTFVTSKRLVAGDAFVFLRGDNGELRVGRRFTGTIVGVGDISPEWSGSIWRSLKIQWDEPATIQRPERVSPWDIEPFAAPASPNLTQQVVKNKRPRPTDIPTSAASSFWYHGSTQSHELAQLGCSTEVQSSESHVWSMRQKEIDSSLLNNSSSSCNTRARPEGIWPSSPHMNVSLNFFPDSAGDNDFTTTRSIISGFPSPMSSRQSNCLINEQVEKGRKYENSAGCRLFGIDLTSNSGSSAPPEKEPSYPIVDSNGTKVLVPAASEAERAQTMDVSMYSKEQKQVFSEALLKESQSKQGSATSTRTCTKVQMQGIAVGRALDLTAVKGYRDLINELEKMFEIEGELSTPKKWAVVFTDDEGDMMLLGDDPWLEFCKMVKKIFIYSSDEVKKTGTRCKLSASSFEGEGTVVSMDSEHRSDA